MAERETVMKTCCYCGSQVIQGHKGKYYCDFCEMVIDSSSLCENSERKEIPIRKIYFDVNYNKTIPELMTLSTFELIQLLQHARAYRTTCWDDWKTVKKIAKASKKDETMQQELVEQAIKNAKEHYELYQYATRKMFVFENLLCERLGYIPKRVSRSYIEKYEDLMEEKKRSSMRVNPFHI